MLFFKDLDFSPLRGKTVVVDIDGTLVADGGETPEPEAAAALQNLARQSKVYLFSNKRNSARNLRISRALGVKLLPAAGRKPFSKIAENVYETKIDWVIGDKVLTDGMWARKIGAKFIRVRRICSPDDGLAAKIACALDDLAADFLGTAALFRLAGTERPALTILSHAPWDAASFAAYLARQLRRLIKKVLFYASRNPRFTPDLGPEAVLASLRRGLDAFAVPYRLNPRAKNVSEVVHVISDVRALAWSIEAKRRGRVQKLIAGPNLTAAPDADGGILCAREIDVILVPSAWVKDFYSSVSPGLAGKIRVWAAGSEAVRPVPAPKELCLIYNKNAPKDLFGAVAREAQAAGLPIAVLNYGSFSRSRYFNLLERSRLLIYLSEHESQGMALQEAWMRDVPSLVWNRGYMKWRKYEWRDSKISAPYLSSDCGRFFRNAEEFPAALAEFLRDLQKFRPREYALKNLSDKVSARNYLEILREVQA
jgi:predicted HAD superfamily phosphohydrolase YqeG